jgi:hypothetical protein
MYYTHSSQDTLTTILTILEKPERTAAESEVTVWIPYSHPYDRSLFNIFEAVLSPAFAD